MNIHAVSHSLPHRGPGASRARTRWQPYASNVSLPTVPKASPAVYLHTPPSSIASASPPSIHLHPLSEPQRSQYLIQPVPTANPLRDTQKTKYAAKLVDQAVKSLCDTWHPDDIPTVFTACGRESLCAQPEPPASPSPIAAGFSKLFGPRNTQLPSPVSPTTRPSPSPPADGCESYTQAPESSGGSNLIPIKAFVHEVLRRSRTSTGVLQTALCYLEAVRSKVPELLRQEKACPTSDRLAEEEDIEPRIVQGIVGKDLRDELVNSLYADAPDKTAGPIADNIRVNGTHLASETNADIPSNKAPAAARSKEKSDLPPLPPLPSPLCCPRRTFLACLILASKFMQDRSYSNRAWAKLAGLPPREIGRCERALGEALEWRLWVGKIPTGSSASPSASSAGRAFSRTRSDGDLLAPSSPTCTSSSAAAWAATATAAMDAQRSNTSSQAIASIPTPLPTPRTTRTLRRSATVPAIVPDGPAAQVDPFFVPECRFGGVAACYDARLAPGLGYPAASPMDVEPQVEVSPSLSTPTLSYSPMSCTSSSSDGSEERTIQMSMFIDLPTPSLSFTSTSSSSVGPWVASSATYTPADPANPHRAANHINVPSFQQFYNTNTLSTYAVESGVVENEKVMSGVTGPAFSAATATKAAPVAATTTLPSFAEAFPSSGWCPGVPGFGSR